MRHSVLISLMLPTLMWGMNEQGPYQLKEADFDLWRAIDDGDDNGVLAALKAGANPNYVWPENESEIARYADLSPVMYAIKCLRAQNRKNYVSALATSLAWDIGKAGLSYALPQITAQYSAVKYIEPLWNTRTAAFLVGSQSGSQQLADNATPAKRLVLDLLTHKDTNLKVKRMKQWKDKDGKLYDVTALSYLTSMRQSWNYFTRKDGEDLALKLRYTQLGISSPNRMLDERGILLGMQRPIASNALITTSSSSRGESIFRGVSLHEDEVFPKDLEQASRERQLHAVTFHYVMPELFSNTGCIESAAW